MAEEKWTVVFGLGAAGDGIEGSSFSKVATKAGSTNKSVAETGYPKRGTVVVVEAESEGEAAEAVRLAYGPGNVTGKFLVAKTTNLKEVSPI
jgi:hypothetical protein